MDQAYILSTVSNEAIGKGGLISINTNNLSLSNSSILSVGSEGRGDGGYLTINATKRVLIDSDSKINSTLESGEGKGGEIRVNTDSLIIQNKGILQVTTEGVDAEAGKIKVNANSIYLLNSGGIEARTQSGNGGDIDLTVQKLLLLRNQGTISTSAGTVNAGGNGGTITINIPKGFIVAVPKENSDITANAYFGTGGKIKITAQGIFGLVPRTRSDLETILKTKDPTKLNPKNISTSDITAISQENALLNGEIIVNGSVNPNQNVAQIPKEPLSNEITDSCQNISEKESIQFFDIGRGGLPPRPEDPLSIDLPEWIMPIPHLASPRVETSETWPLALEPSSKFSLSKSLRLVPPCQSH